MENFSDNKLEADVFEKWLNSLILHNYYEILFLILARFYYENSLSSYKWKFECSFRIGEVWTSI